MTGTLNTKPNTTQQEDLRFLSGKISKLITEQVD